MDSKTDLSQDYGIIFESVKQLLTALENISIINASLRFPDEIINVTSAISSALQIAHDVAVRNYNAAVIGTLKFLADGVKPYLEKNPHLQEFVSAFLKYGSFASNVYCLKTPMK